MSLFGVNDDNCFSEIYSKTDIDNKLSGKSNTNHNHDSAYTKSDEIRKIKKLTQSQYNALSTKEASTLYIIVG